MNALAPTRTPKSRGQALVLSALGMVLLVLMVCMTLSFGTKAKQKMEVQIAADQAAYSTSVATARTFNLLAMTNRVMIAHMTAMLGIQSAISFATTWYFMASAFWVLYGLEILNQLRCCNWGCAFAGCFTALFVFLNRWIPAFIETMRVWALFPIRDAAAAQQARTTSMVNNAMFILQGLTVSQHLYQGLDKQDTAKRATAAARGSSPGWVVPAGGDKVTKREAGFIGGLGGFGLALGVGAINQSNLILTDRHAVVASMASRGHFFTSIRDSWWIPNGVQYMIRRALQRFNGQNDWQGQYIHMGHGYFSVGFPHSDTTILPTASTFAMADDHGFGVMRYSGPAAVSPLQIPFFNFVTVMSNNSTGFHAGIGIPALPPVWFDGLHQVPAMCLLNCPSAWTNFADYSPWLVADGRDNHALPKAPTTIYKDARQLTPDPFNLMFNFRFTAPGKQLDLADANGIRVRNGPGTADISEQMGYSTGITYYHRGGGDHWDEPPNLFNPYFRAGITRPDTDRAASSIGILGVPLTPDNSTDIEDTMRDSGAGWAADAYCALYDRGYQGIRRCP